MTAPAELYFEDFHLGQKFKSAEPVRVSAKEITEFAEKYDPQPFHLDENAGKSSFFKGLAASGWLTAAIVMRMRVDTIRVPGGMIGAGVEEIRWTEPVRPNDQLRTETEVIGLRRSKKRPELGLVTIYTLTLNQRDEVVMKSTVKFLAPLRSEAGAPQ
ncbi:MAG: MaoC family dehydratase [Terriglobus roseus]|nr:MaoC family dehydratase [Terriglobus roseus]